MPGARDADAAIFAAVRTIHRAMAEVISPILHRAGFTNGQFFLLYFIEKMDRPTVGEIADQLGVGMPTVTHLLNDLEGRGLVRRERSSEDRRVVRLVVTSRGSTLLARVEDHALDQVRAASSGIADAQKSSAAGLLNEIAARIRNHKTPHARVRGSRPPAASAPRRKAKKRGERP